MNASDRRCEPFRHDLGAYVVGGLEPHEERTLEQHLALCEACRADHDDIARLPPLLDVARRSGPEVPTRLRDRVVAEAARRQGRRRWVLTTAAAALVAGIAGAGLGWQLTPEPDPAIAVPLESVEPFEEAGGWATVSRDGDALVVSLDVTGLAPLPEPEVYEAWLYTYDQRIVSIGQLDVHDGEVSVELAADGSMRDYRGFWITAEPDRRDPAHDGPTVLRASIPDGP